MEWVVLIAVVFLVLALIATQGGLEIFVELACHAIVGLVLLFRTNLIVSPPNPINPFTILISAIGVVGWLIILILYLLQKAFYVPSSGLS
jgi:hypothetical protein